MMNRRIAAVVLALLPLAATAHDYSHVEAGFLEHEDVDWTDAVVDRGDQRRGYRAALQLALPHAPVAGFVEYTNTFVLDHFSIGLLHFRRVAKDLDVLGGASLELEDITDEKGYGLRAGLRWRPATVPVEFTPLLVHEELFEAATSLRLTLAVPLHRRWHAQGAVQTGDDERFWAGLRYVL